MQKWLGFRSGVEVAGLAPQHQVGDKTRTSGNMLAKLPELVEKEKEKAGQQGCQ